MHMEARSLEKTFLFSKIHKVEEGKVKTDVTETIRTQVTNFPM